MSMVHRIRVQKKFQPSSGCQMFIISLPLLRISKLAKVFELCIVYVSEAFTVSRLYLLQSLSHYMKALLKLDC